MMKSWVLLYNQLTTDIFCDASAVKNIRRVDQVLKLHTNGGVLLCDHQADLPGYGTVWFDERAITNILSLANVKNKRKIVFNSDTNDEFVILDDEGKKMVFKASPQGLYYIDLKKDEFNMLNTVNENKFPYSGHFFIPLYLITNILSNIMV